MTEKSFETKLGTIRYSRNWHKRSGIPLHWIEDAGHNSNTDKPDIINGLIESFLENEVR
jgi:pimeloyl-ACP methyl ester carboxylesterase